MDQCIRIKEMDPRHHTSPLASPDRALCPSPVASPDGGEVGRSRGGGARRQTEERCLRKAAPEGGATRAEPGSGAWTEAVILAEILTGGREQSRKVRNESVWVPSIGGRNRCLHGSIWGPHGLLSPQKVDPPWSCSKAHLFRK